MAENSKIEWCDSTWNPVRGRTKVSAGCKNCYAETFAERFRGVPSHPFEQGFDLRLVPEKLGDPLKWKKPRRIFVNSMSDLFHPDVPFEYIDRVFAVMALCPQHTFQALTKRIERAEEYLTYSGSRDNPRAAYRIQEAMKVESGKAYAEFPWPLDNLWLGTSVENQAAADERVPHLLRCPAAVRFLSCEPLLGPVDLRRIHFDHMVEIDCLTGDHGVIRPLAGRSDKRIDWIIVGGESGPHARPMHPDWPRTLRDQCEAAGVAFFMKQMDKKMPIPADLLIRQFPEVAHVQG